jgi:hypothetical protein
VSISNQISLEDFYFLYPEITGDCSNLVLGVAYCVLPVGTIVTYPGHTVTSQRITLPPATFSSVNTAIPTSTNHPGFTATASFLPRASGTIEGCDTYRNYDTVNGINDCPVIGYLYDSSTEDLAAWNPSLSSDPNDCKLQPGLSYCVSQTDTTRE